MTVLDTRVSHAASLYLSSSGDVLLVQRSKPPGQMHWTLPAGKVEMGEPALLAALRELREETGLSASSARHLLDVRFCHEFKWMRISVYLISQSAYREPIAGSDAEQCKYWGRDRIDYESEGGQLVRIALDALKIPPLYLPDTATRESS